MLESRSCHGCDQLAGSVFVYIYENLVYLLMLESIVVLATVLRIQSKSYLLELG